MKNLYLAALLLCTPVAMAQLYDPVPSPGPATPILPIGGADIKDGLIIGSRYDVIGRDGQSYSGTVVGDSKFSVTIPDGPGPNVINANGVIIVQP